jgi:hypothetical protein
MTDEVKDPPKQELIGPRGRFLPGNQAAKGRGRPKGRQNNITVSMKEAMNQVADEAGYDGKGAGGRAGYLKRIAEDNPELFTAAWLKATVPPAREGGETDSNRPRVNLILNLINVPYKHELTPAAREWVDAGKPWAECPFPLTRPMFAGGDETTDRPPSTAIVVTGPREDGSTEDPPFVGMKRDDDVRLQPGETAGPPDPLPGPRLVQPLEE